jgi:hypothetical protein
MSVAIGCFIQHWHSLMSVAIVFYKSYSSLSLSWPNDVGSHGIAAVCITTCFFQSNLFQAETLICLKSLVAKSNANHFVSDSKLSHRLSRGTKLLAHDRLQQDFWADIDHVQYDRLHIKHMCWLTSFCAGQTFGIS